MKQMRKKDWSHELTLAFAAPAPMACAGKPLHCCRF